MCFNFRLIKFVSSLLFSILLCCNTVLSQEKSNPFGIVIHGGAGTILKENMTPELEEAYKQKLLEALQTGYVILKENGNSLDAVEAAIRILEDSPLFNAGKGAVFTNDATNELDSSMMDGRTLNAGSVAGVKHIKNPISLARVVMEKSPHVMLVGDGAEEFAVQHNLERVSQYYFYTEKRWKSLQKSKEAEKEKTTLIPDQGSVNFTEKELGTVGAVALDKSGNLAAGTSTGGMNNKKVGRVGDSPIIGAGTYANNQTCAISGTGHGEYFMRLLVAYDVHALMAYEGKSLNDAAETVIMKKLGKLGGTGGIIAIDKDGNIAMPFNTKGMYRGYIQKDGKSVVKIYQD